LAQDETKIATNEGPCHVWLKGDQQPLKKKGNRQGIHVSDWICGYLTLSPEQVASKLQLPKQSCLQTTDAHKIIYPGKNHNAWWDLNQLHDQTVDAADIFDCSSAHEGLAADALNVNNMNVNPGGKQKLLHTTVIPINNPPPKPDTQGLMQTMVYPDDVDNLSTTGTMWNYYLLQFITGTEYLQQLASTCSTED
jgi:hypothetical protein